MGNVCNTRHVHGCGPFFARLLISLIFIFGGIGKVIDFRGASEALRSMGVPGAEVYIFVGLLMELIGGILLLLGCYSRLGALILMIFLLPTTLIFHSFWIYDGAEMALQLSIFLRNLAIYGGLLMVICYGPGCWSVDACRCKKQQPDQP